MFIKCFYHSIFNIFEFAFQDQSANTIPKHHIVRKKKQKKQKKHLFSSVYTINVGGIYIHVQMAYY